MSGGYFNYTDSQFKTELFGWTDKSWNVLEDREISDMTWDLLNLIHTFDYYKSGDCSKEKYLAEKKLFKNKWFSNRGVRVRNVIDTAIEELKEELYETYGITNEECLNREIPNE